VAGDPRIGQSSSTRVLASAVFVSTKSSSFVASATSLACDFSMLKEVEKIICGEPEQLLAESCNPQAVGLARKKPGLFGDWPSSRTPRRGFDSRPKIANGLMAGGPPSIRAYGPTSSQKATRAYHGNVLIVSALTRCSKNADAYLLLYRMG